MSKDMAKPGREPTKPGSASPPPAGLLGRLRRSGKNAVLAGVCGGLGEVTEIPVWGWRLIFLAGLPLSAFGLLGCCSWPPPWRISPSGSSCRGMPHRGQRCTPVPQD